MSAMLEPAVQVQLSPLPEQAACAFPDHESTSNASAAKQENAVLVVAQ
jgi:hypothetical protein